MKYMILMYSDPVETKRMSAYYMIDCKGLGRAFSLAERILGFHVTAMEVRPVHDSVDMTLIIVDGSWNAA